MNRILFFLQQLVTIPFQMVLAPLGLSESVFRESPRGRALILGSPAVLIAVIGISLVSWASVGNVDLLEVRYQDEAQQASLEKLAALRELQIEIRSTGYTAESGVEPSDKQKLLQAQVTRLKKKELIYLNKLISLNPKKLDYRYQLADATFDPQSPSEIRRAVALMQSLAPEDFLGFGKAHMWLANWYWKLRPRSNDNLDRALRHANFCLIGNPNNPVVLRLKATLLVLLQKRAEAYEIFAELFKSEPRFYVELVQLNESLGNAKRKELVLDDAQARFTTLIRDSASEVDDVKWTYYWENLITVLNFKKSFETAEEILVEELKTFDRQFPADIETKMKSRKIVIRSLLVLVYNTWSGDLAAGKLPTELTDDVIGKQLELLSKALQAAPNNQETLRQIVRIGYMHEPFGSRAKALYDPEQDADVSAPVLNEMGSQALLSERYNDAIRHFEKARRKIPGDVTILNNLAYSYLVVENRDPDQALQLINRAIRNLPNVRDPEKRRMYSSNFLDTKGHALLQLNRVNEAVSQFEGALAVRPDEPKILSALVTCYEKLGDPEQAAVYRRRLEKAEKEQAAEQGDGAAEASSN